PPVSRRARPPPLALMSMALPASWPARAGLRPRPTCSWRCAPPCIGSSNVRRAEYGDGGSSARLDSVSRAEALINLDAIRGNVATLKRATPAEVMAVVKADGYGHGLLPVARAALAGGATWLGTAIIDEALLLRAAGIQV